MRRPFLFVFLFLTLVFLLIFKLTAAPVTPPPADEEALWAARTEFVGDNSAVSNLLEKTGVGTYGTFSFGIESNVEPYGVTVFYEKGTASLAKMDLEKPAVLFLGLVANAEFITFTNAAGETFTLTVAGADKAVGGSVKNLGRSRNALHDYLEKH